MNGEFVFSGHSRLRITQRMKLTPLEVEQKVKAGLMVEVITIGVFKVRKYGVLWDPEARKPFLLIWKKVDDVWSLSTVYETFPNHWRKDWVRIQPYHCYGAKRRHLDFVQAEEEANRKAKESVVHLDLIVHYLTPERKPRTSRYRLGQIGREDFELRLKSDAKLLFNELLSSSSLELIEVPKDAAIRYEVYRRVGKKKLVIGGGEL